MALRAGSILKENQLFVREKKGWNDAMEEGDDHKRDGSVSYPLKCKRFPAFEADYYRDSVKNEEHGSIGARRSASSRDRKNRFLMREAKQQKDFNDGDDGKVPYGYLGQAMEASFSSGREKNRWNDAKEEEDGDDEAEAEEEEEEEDFGDLHDLVRDKKPEDQSRSLSSSIHGSSKRQDVNQEDVSLCNALICMHSNCGRLVKAQEVLVRDQKLEDRSRSLSSSINASSKRQDVNQEDVFHCNALICMYVKCGRLAKAQEVLDGIPARNVVSWNSMISGYAREGIGWKALDCLTRMREEGISPNAVTLTSILKVCGAMQSVERGKEIHSEATKKGLSRSNVMLGTALIDMYAKCGELAAALHVSEQLPKRDVVSWTALIAGYVRHGFCDEALDCFSRMKSEGLVPNRVTFSCILKACGSRRSIELGQEIHAEVEKRGLLEKDVVLGTTLVDMYGKCGMLHKAQQVFDRLPVRNVVCWTALIAGYVQHELGDEALASFAQMRREGFSPDATAFACVLKACGNLRCIDKGEEIHGEIAERGLLEGDVILRTALIDMYAKCGAIGKAQKAFDEIATPKNVVCWNALIAGYVQHELAAEALRCFVRMRAMGLSPDAFTFACVLRACGQSGSADKGREIHAELRKQRLLGKDQVLGNALVDMYARCGLVIEAQEAFDELPAQDAVAWNVLISGYTRRGLYDEALGRFEQMQENNLPPDQATFACVLKACGSSGSARKGKEIHAELNLRCFLGRNAELGTALVDMYAMCGMIGEAEEMFEGLPVRDTVSWNVLLSGYAQLGRGKQALNAWKRMLGSGSTPDAITFVVLLSACSLAGLVEEAQICFSAMDSAYCFAPSLEHRACMVKLFSHSGQLGRAVAAIETVREADRVHLWSALIGSCQKCSNLGVGRWAFEQLVQLDRDNPVAYVCMSNMYAFAAMQSEQL